MNSRVPSPCIRSTSSVSFARLVRSFSNRFLSAAAVALLGVASIPSSQAAGWFVENFEQYTTVPSSCNATLTPQLNATAGAATVVSSSGNKVLQYAKLTAAATGGSLTYSLSTPNFSTARTKGFVSFKVTANLDPSVAVAKSYLAFRLGTNDVNGVASSNSAFVDIRMYQPVTTVGIASYSNNTQAGSNTTALPSGTNTIRVWFNSEATGMAYTDPSGNAQTLAAGTYVAYVNTTLINGNASGSTMATSVTATGATASSAIGKIGFNVTSSSTADFSIDDIYAGDSAPVVTTPPGITSAASATGYPGVAFTYSLIADQAITSYALASGALPAGLSLNTTTGVISGTPVATGGPTTVGLTATNTNGTSSAFSLSINIINPLNTFTGSNASLNNGTWSLGATPTSTASIGSFQDVALASSATDLTTSSGNIFAKTWNVTNGSSYSVSSTSSNTTIFHMGHTGNSSITTFTNSVSGVQNDLVYLAGNSSLTLAPTNLTANSTASTVELRSSGNLNIGANSTLTLSAVIMGSSKALTKTGNGTLVLSAANTYSGNTTLSAGTLTLSGSASPTTLVRATSALSGAGVASVTVVDGGSGYTVAPAVSFVKGTGDTTGSGAAATATISGGVVTAITVTNAGTGYTVPPLVYVYSTQSPLGTGAVTLSGGTLNATVDAELSRTTTYAAGNATDTYFRINSSSSSNALTINGTVTINVADSKTVSAYTFVGGNNTSQVITKSGNGTLWLRGGAAATMLGSWNVTSGTLFIGTSSSTAMGSGKISMNGGNLRFSKGISSTGTYTGHGQDLALEVLQDTTITLDANPLSIVGGNTASFKDFTIGNRTITLVKSSTAISSANSTANVTYTDPALSFLSGNLTSNATFDTGALTQLSLVSIAGSGGLTKTGTGRLLLGSGNASFTNSYTGATAISAGTLTLAGNHTSAITLGNSTILELDLVAPVVSTAALTFSSNASVKIIGTPAGNTTYDLVTASAITGNATLSPSITGFLLVKTGNSTVLRLASDTTAPVISRTGNATVSVSVGATYTDAGASVTDNLDSGVTYTATITPGGSIDTAAPGVYTVTYTATDAAGNAATAVTRTVTVADTTAPVITRTGSATVSMSAGATYTDAGATATDNVDTSVTVTTSDTVNTATPGVYTITYNATDAAGNAATAVTRTVTVSDTTAPVITRTGSATVSVNTGTTYTDAGATATDNVDTSVTVTTTITPGGSVNTAAAGVYTVTYTATDAAGNAATAVTRTVTVVSADSIAPVITRTGSATVSVAWGASYTDAGATATDNVDPSVTVITTITPGGSVNTAKPGVYTVTYAATDAAGNIATPVTRAVTVAIANPTTVGADGLTPLMRYALGANSPTDSVQAIVMSSTSNTLSLTAVVRTDDPKLTVLGKTNTDLTLSANWTSTGVSGSPAGSGTTGDQTGVTGSLVRKVYTVTSGSRTFLRLEATLAP
jgi:autotransporter-associated beta strand protein